LLGRLQGVIEFDAFGADLPALIRRVTTCPATVSKKFAW
jgi:hypothetical protein